MVSSTGFRWEEGGYRSLFALRSGSEDSRRFAAGAILGVVYLLGEQILHTMVFAEAGRSELQNVFAPS